MSNVTVQTQIGCAFAQYPGVYAEVYQELEWIKSNSQGGGSGKCDADKPSPTEGTTEGNPRNQTNEDSTSSDMSATSDLSTTSDLGTISDTLTKSDLSTTSDMSTTSWCKLSDEIMHVLKKI